LTAKVNEVTGNVHNMNLGNKRHSLKLYRCAISSGTPGQSTTANGISGLTFYEIMIAMAIFAIASSAALTGLLQTQQMAMLERYNTGTTHTLRGVGDLVLAANFQPFTQEHYRALPRGQNQGDSDWQGFRFNRMRFETAIDGFLKMPGDARQTGNAVANLFPQWPASLHPDNFEYNRAAFSPIQLLNLDGTSGNGGTFSVPLGIAAAADADRIDSEANFLHGFETIGELRRTVLHVDTELLVGGDRLSGEDFRLRQIDLEVEFRFRNTTHVLNVRMFRAPNE